MPDPPRSKTFWGEPLTLGAPLSTHPTKLGSVSRVSPSELVGQSLAPVGAESL